MNLSRLKHLALAAGLLLAMAGPGSAQQVNVELALLVDESDSVTQVEYDLQMLGYRDAFLDPNVQNTIASAPLGVAVSLIVFSGAANQAVEVDWFHIQTVQDSIDFAGLIEAAIATRPFSGQTGIGEALNFAVASIENNEFEGIRRVIDVSGDGKQNTIGAGIDDPANITFLQNARDAAFSSGIRVNGLAIVTDEFADLEAYYNANVRTPDGFVAVAQDFSDFATTVRGKIIFEVAGAPEPGSAALIGISALALGGIVTRRRKA
jgi:hypothetical protein